MTPVDRHCASIYSLVQKLADVVLASRREHGTDAGQNLIDSVLALLAGAAVGRVGGGGGGGRRHRPTPGRRRRRRIALTEEDARRTGRRSEAAAGVQNDGVAFGVRRR